MADFGATGYSFSQGSVLGGSIGTAELETNAVTAAKLAATLAPFVLLDTCTLAADTATLSTTATLTGYTKYLVIFAEAGNDTGADDFKVEFNDDAGGVYDFAGAGLSVGGLVAKGNNADSGIQVGRCDAGTNKCGGYFFIGGAVASNKIVSGCCTGSRGQLGFTGGGTWYNGVPAAITKIKLKAGGNKFQAGLKMWVYGLLA